MLDPGRLAIGTSATLTYPLYDGQELADGAWLLVRLRRRADYSGVRGWFDKERALRAAVQNLVDDVSTGMVDAAAALPRLRPGAAGMETLFDELRALRQIIQLDGAIHEAEAKRRVAAMIKAFADARAAIERHAAPAGPALLARGGVSRALEAFVQAPGGEEAPKITADADLLHEKAVAEARRAARPV
ncbi:hypothetical protein [Sorangium sp. So ce385]|uniref:hypothetical protein n=1 Tax=Sorangium sp. So ce385 TaxID=3133308 RepID=UPI003F5B4526